MDDVLKLYFIINQHNDRCLNYVLQKDGTTFEFDGDMVSFGGVICPLPELDTEHGFWHLKITLSNDRRLFSQPIDLLLYHSECVSCTENRECSMAVMSSVHFTYINHCCALLTLYQWEVHLKNLVI